MPIIVIVIDHSRPDQTGALLRVLRRILSKRGAARGAGPAALPLEVLEEAQASLTDFGGSGMSVMEISHRSPEFIEIANVISNCLLNPEDLSIKKECKAKVLSLCKRFPLYS